MCCVAILYFSQCGVGFNPQNEVHSDKLVSVVGIT